MDCWVERSCARAAAYGSAGSLIGASSHQDQQILVCQLGHPANYRRNWPTSRNSHLNACAVLRRPSRIVGGAWIAPHCIALPPLRRCSLFAACFCCEIPPLPPSPFGSVAVCHPARLCAVVALLIVLSLPPARAFSASCTRRAAHRILGASVGPVRRANSSPSTYPVRRSWRCASFPTSTSPDLRPSFPLSPSSLRRRLPAAN